jgi:hypothetical protein
MPAAYRVLEPRPTNAGQRLKEETAEPGAAT